MTRALLLTLIFVANFAAASVDTQYLQGLGDSRYHFFPSKTHERDFHIYVMLPDDYDADAGNSYPAIYLLDGGALFPLMTAYYRYLNFAEEVPDAIIVGISYGADDFESGNYRSTDYTAKSEEREYWGGADRFQVFLSEELLPFVETGYAANPDRRILFGQSLGGQFVLYSALTQPRLFWGRIASNPALHRNLAFFLEDHASGPAGNPESRLFVASGTDDDPVFRGPARQWMQHWTGMRDTPWELRTMDLEGHSHMSAPPAAFREGLRWLFPPAVE